MTDAERLVVGVDVVQGDVLEKVADVLVNPWNRNYLPRLLLVASGVSGQLKRRTGSGPWRELAGRGLLGVGEAVVTGAGDLDTVRWLVHVAGLTAWWRASETSVRLSTINAVHAAHGVGARTVVMPLIGSGTGGMAPERSLQVMLQALNEFSTASDLEFGQADLEVRIVLRPSGFGH